MATVARTKQDVDNMTRQERLWDSLNHAYGQQREASDRSFDKAYSQADRQALSRGMQRSSYNAQNLAGINNQKIKAQGDIWNNQIADYENRLGTLEQQEAEAERWERQFNASREDAQWNRDFQQKQFDAGRDDVAWNRAFQQKQADTANQQWQLNFDASRADTAFNQGMQEKQFAANQDQNAWQRGMTEKQYADSRADTAWQQGMTEKQYADSRADTAFNQGMQEKQFAANQEQNAWQRGMTEKQYADSRADTAWNQNFQQSQFDANQEQNAWQRGMTERQYADSRADTAWNQNFQQSQADRSADQWERQFAQGNSDADRQLAASYVAAIVAQGGTPSDELLARAGLSRADAEAMRKGATGGSNGPGNPGPSNPGDNPPPGNPDSFLDDVDLGNTTSGTKNLAKELGLGLYKNYNNMANNLGGLQSTPFTYLPNYTAGKATTPASSTALVDNNNGNANRYQSPNNVTINPIEAAFSVPVEEYYEVDLDNENDPRVLGKSKTSSAAGSKIKSTVVKKNN